MFNPTLVISKLKSSDSIIRGDGSSLKLGGQALNKLRKEVARLNK